MQSEITQLMDNAQRCLNVFYWYGLKHKTIIIYETKIF